MSYYKPGPDPSPQLQEQLGGWTVLGLLALALLVPFIGPLIGIFYGIANTRKGGAWAIIGGGIALLALQLLIGGLAMLALPGAERVRAKALEAEVKQNLHSIQIALERYAADDPDGNYPLDISALTEKQYLAEFPKNPFTGQPMRAIKLGSEPFEGEFTYVPRMAGAVAPGYDLYAYGSSKTVSQTGPPGLKHVIIQLGSGILPEIKDPTVAH